jgi:hypothetical protein
MYEISDVKSWIACIDTRYTIRLFDDILFNAPVVFLILDPLIFEIIDKQTLEVNLFKVMFTDLSDCFIDDLDDGF